jgi:regulator of protease activity HflC (stomatin/prohibitin superfamily)
VNLFFQWLVDFIKQFRFFVTVLPWERAVRVRLGNRVQLWEPGWHFRLPFADEVVLQSTKLRISGAGPQTISTKDGKILTLSMSIGFCIADPLAAMLRMHHPEIACASIASSIAAGVVARTTHAELKPADIEAEVLRELAKESGYAVEFVKVTDFAFARAFRLLSENPYRQQHVDERAL